MNPGIPNRKYYRETYLKNNPKLKENDTFNCEICNITAPTSLEIYHCFYCNLCVAHHDHHCSYIGKCITKRNRLFFYFSIFSIPVFFVVTFVTFILYIIYIHEENFKERKMVNK